MRRRAVAEKGVDVSRLRQKPGKTAVTQVLLEDGDRVLGDYDEGVLADYRLSPEDLDFLQGFDVVVCDLWGKVGGQFRELQARGVPTAFDGADRLFCSESEVYAEEGKVVMLCERDARLKIYPAPAKAPCGFRETGREGVFTVYEKAVRPSLFSVSVRRGGAGEKYRDFELEVSVAEDYPHTAWLEIGYEGDRLEIFLDGEKVADDFYTGVPYAFGLRDYGFPSRISVRVWEMRQDAFIYTERKPLFEEGKACRYDIRTCISARYLPAKGVHVA